MHAVETQIHENLGQEVDAELGLAHQAHAQKLAQDAQAVPDKAEQRIPVRAPHIPTPT
jgi:hypothetical protein